MIFNIAIPYNDDLNHVDDMARCESILDNCGIVEYVRKSGCGEMHSYLFEISCTENQFLMLMISTNITQVTSEEILEIYNFSK